MKQISFDLTKYQQPVEPKSDRRGQHYLFAPEETPENVLEARLSEYYGKQCQWIVRKFGYAKTMLAFDLVEKQGDKDFTHLMQNLFR